MHFDLTTIQNILPEVAKLFSEKLSVLISTFKAHPKEVAISAGIFTLWSIGRLNSLFGNASGDDGDCGDGFDCGDGADCGD